MIQERSTLQGKNEGLPESEIQNFLNEGQEKDFEEEIDEYKALIEEYEEAVISPYHCFKYFLLTIIGAFFPSHL